MLIPNFLKWLDQLGGTIPCSIYNNKVVSDNDYSTRAELDLAIRQLNKDKSVGPDDIPNEAIIK